MDDTNFELLLENCERIAQKDIRINGYNWKAWRYFDTAMRAFDHCKAVESIALACDIFIEGELLPGVVMLHRDGRVYPMSAEGYKAVFGMEIEL